ncbi:MAG TPA: N-glycosylase/DNA lyase [Thermoplasmata archaeon]|nr:N-glycosylase/DNA lyase [Thermoplasmata archaeon]
MNDLPSTINNLKHSDTQRKIYQRIQEFKTIDTHSAEELFKELCFCILTANFDSERTIHIHGKLHPCFCTETKKTLSKKLRQHGYRFPNTRATYIVQSIAQKDNLPFIIHTLDHEGRRDWLAENIPGIGYKEASHFLRNIGFDDYAIIDFHILDILERYHLIKKPKTLTVKKYKEIEQVLQTIATQTNLTLAELDLYLWYIETGKILK